MNEDLCDFVRLKIFEIQSSIDARRQSQAVLLTGSDEEWQAAAKLHPSTSHLKSLKKDRIELSAREARIILKLRHEISIFTRILNELQTPK